MGRVCLWLTLGILGLGCGAREARPGGPQQPAVTPGGGGETLAVTETETEAETESESEAESETETEAGSEAEPDAESEAASEAEPDAGAGGGEGPAPVVRSGGAWPFHRWDRAEAVLFNQFFPARRAPLYAYDQNGWSPHVAEKKKLTAAQARRAVQLIRETRGAVSVSRCPFPRHAVVLYDGDVPVASINVCFECGDILVWPRFEREPDWETMNRRQRKQWRGKQAKKLKLYDRVFPQWKGFFGDDLGYELRVSD